MSAVHLIGICGTGMASLAGLLRAQGHVVSGSDAGMYEPMATVLRNLAIEVARFDSINIDRFRPEIVVCGHVFNGEVQRAVEGGIEVLSLPEAVARFLLSGREPVVVTGTHGKTTTTSMIAWMLSRAGRDPSAFIGGLASNFETSFVHGSGPSIVVEGDEFSSSMTDRRPKFAHYRPSLLVINNIEHDHLDLYADVEALKGAFIECMQTWGADTTVLVNGDDDHVQDLLDRAQQSAISFGLSSAADYRALDLELGADWSAFSLRHGGEELGRFRVPVPGIHNLRNALAAVAACSELGLSPQEVRSGLAGFLGVRRRMEIITASGDSVVIDDFAHHPSAIAATLSSVRAAYPERRIVAVFEPSTPSYRTDALLQPTATALANADQVIARVATRPGLEGGLPLPSLVAELNARDVPAAIAEDLEELVSLVRDIERPGDVLVVMSTTDTTATCRALAELVGRVDVVAREHGPGVPLPEDQRIHRLFELQVDRRPSDLALVAGSVQLSYRDLDRKANQLAHYLSGRGIGPGARVGLAVAPGPSTVVALLAVLKTGAAYVPIDPSSPRARQALMVEDAELTLLLSDPVEIAHDCPVELIDDALGGCAGGACTRLEVGTRDDLAYLIYTSGSTGTPKAVAVPHRCVVGQLTAMTALLGPEPGVWLATTSLSFDPSVIELLWTLVSGFTVVIAPALATPATIETLLTENAISHFQCTPQRLRALVSTPSALLALRQLRVLLVGGEELPARLAQQITKGASVRLYNVYGPTETTVWATAEHIVAGAVEGRVPIGKPLANTKALVVNDLARRQPTGVWGELYLGGLELSDGYWKRPELTSERFVTGDDGERFYRTGDIVRWRPDSRLEYRGRADNQVKIRGVRIELGEVEAAIARHPAVHDAVVLAEAAASGEIHMAAFIVTPASAGPVPDIRAFLAALLPTAMIPTRFTTIESIPLTLNGKVDRTRLRTAPPAQRRPVTGTQPADDVEAAMLHTWAAVLEHRPLEVSSNFFEVGGDSLAALEISERIRRRFGVELAPTTFFQTPTVAGVAALVRQAEGPTISSADRDPLIVPLKVPDAEPRRAALPVFCLHSIRPDLADYLEFADQMGRDRPVYGIRCPGTEPGEELESDLEGLAGRHIQALTRFRPTGTLLLVGYSLGGMIATEVAAQLQAAGREVRLVLIDPHLFTSADDSARRNALFEESDLGSYLRFEHIYADPRPYLRASTALFAAWKRFEPPRLSAPTLYLQACSEGGGRLTQLKRTVRSHDRLDRRWTAALSQLEVIKLNGSHWELLSGNTLETVASAINLWLADSTLRTNARASLPSIMRRQMQSVPMAMLAWWINAYKTRTQERAADCIVVPGAWVSAYGRPSIHLRARVANAARLYREQLASHVVLTGGSIEGRPAEALVARRLALQFGIPDDALTVEERSTNTYQNFEELAQIMRERRWTSCLISSSPYHMLRCMLIAKELNLVPYPAPARGVEWEPTRDLRTEPRSLATYLAIRTQRILRRSYPTPGAS